MDFRSLIAEAFRCGGMERVRFEMSCTVLRNAGVPSPLLGALQKRPYIQSPNVLNDWTQRTPFRSLGSTTVMATLAPERDVSFWRHSFLHAQIRTQYPGLRAHTFRTCCTAVPCSSSVELFFFRMKASANVSTVCTAVGRVPPCNGPQGCLSLGCWYLSGQVSLCRVSLGHGQGLGSTS